MLSDPLSNFRPSENPGYELKKGNTKANTKSGMSHVPWEILNSYKDSIIEINLIKIIFGQKKKSTQNARYTSVVSLQT